jgi:hypothetical protein
LASRYSDQTVRGLWSYCIVAGVYTCHDPANPLKNGEKTKAGCQLDDSDLGTETVSDRSSFRFKKERVAQ